MEAETSEQVRAVRTPGLSDITGAPVFRDPSTLTHEQMTDPDYRLKSLQKEYGGRFNITCTRCHHCR